MREAGLDVQDRTIGITFADLHVTDRATGDESDLQLGANYREFPPARISCGPVLDIRDAVAGKMSALWSRGEARDYIDIDTVVGSGRSTRSEVREISDSQELLPMGRPMLASRFRRAATHPAEVFAAYGVDAGQRDALIARFAQWADEIDPELSPGAPFQ